ncbi:helix-turn-helix domain-containing protein [Modestobacter roseus]|uniref:AraC-like DNA-binding protein n=1 Tax=Modestobacter roseus TaxID=1181884 RepID=A0A562IPP1_9ACTN|nr:helix-turn-helix domain-containing protein [Modestobacter roseus]MQA35371.1 helix-turn-helix domain-containing protein [Modestobacter roseus]TWH72766.1 AraC-like DNA-binding protein [Modestobacter roseus]
MVQPVAGALAVSVASSFTEWQDLVSRSFVPLSITRRRPAPFRAVLQSRELRDATLCRISAASHTVRRTQALIGSAQPVHVKLSVQLAGTCLLVQDGREAVLTPGDLAVYDTSRPYTLAFDEDVESMVLMFPRDLLDLPADLIGQLTAVRMAADAGLARVVSPFLSQLAQHMDQVSGPSGLRLAHSALDLVSTLLGEQLGADREADPHRRLVTRIRAYIEANLGDPDLCPDKVAAAHHISTRHLHNVFSAEGTTVAAWIRARRLEHCRRDLLDPLQSDRTVAALAARRGFSDPTHFSRAFKEAFDLSPSAYRHLAAG